MAIPKEPRQAMINMMYLVLTALLALNVSAEILNAFTLVNDGIKVSVKALEDKNTGLMDALAEKAENDVTVKPYYDKALQAQKTADAATDRIDEMIEDIYNIVGFEVNEDGERKLSNPGDTHKGHFYMINEGHGEELQNLLNDTREEFVDYVKPENRESFRNTISLKAEEPPAKEGVKKSWAEFNFADVPAIAAITLLNKYKNDIRDAEASLIENLAGESLKQKIVFDALKGRAISNNSYVNVGETYEADIFVSATSKSVDPVVHIGQLDPARVEKGANGEYSEVKGGGVPIIGEPKTLTEAENGIVKYEVPATSTGVRTYTGVVEITNTQTGEKSYYPFEQKYTVAGSMAVVSPTKMNVFYVGVDNPVDVSAPGYQPGQVSARISSGTIQGSNGKYTVRVPATGDVTVSVFANSDGTTRKVGDSKFRAKRIPDPTPFFGNRTSGVISAAEVKAIPGLAARAEGFDFDVTFQIRGYEVTYKKTRTTSLQVIQNNGAMFNNQVNQLFKTVGPGDQIWIDNIRVNAPDNTTRTLNMSLKVI